MATKLKKFLKSFTLIELIIVIAIISVLGVSAFLLVSQWIGKSRDSRRISDLKTLEKTIQISFVSKESVNYPDPDPRIEIKYDKYGILWYQGKFGENMTDFVGNLNKIPKDPRGDYYEYSLTQDKKFYQLLAILENEKQVSYGIENVYANDYETTYMLTNYRGYLIKKLGEELYLLKTDTLMLDPVKIDEYSGEYELDSQQDILKKDDSYKNRVQIITGDISGLLSNDLTIQQNTITEIKNTFPQLDSPGAINEIIKVVGATVSIQTPSLLSCDAHEYSGYNFNVINHGDSQIQNKTFAITDGTQTLQLTATCNNGVVNYGEEQSDINCDEGKVLQSGNCVNNLCQGILPTNAQLNGTQGVTGTWSYNETMGLCHFNCINGYNYQGGICVENNCSAETKTIDGHIFIIPTMNHGVNQIINSTSELIDNGSITYSQEFECDKGDIQTIGLPSTNEPSCNAGYSPSGSNCEINTYTVSGSFGSNASGASIDVCGSNLIAQADGTFTTIIDHGSTCNNITATKSGYVCNTTTQGPATLTNIFTTVSGTCSAVVNGICGSADGVAIVNAPSSNLCSVGNASSINTTIGNFTWNCNGSGGGTNASCSAPRQYTVTFNENGGLTPSPTSKTVIYNTAIGTLSTVTRSGYTFNGWYTQATAGTQISTSTVINANVTYYAQWTAITYTVSGGFGVGGSGATINVCGTNVTADASGNFTRTGVGYGSNCSNINATKAGYTCNTTVQGPASLTANFTTVAGSCATAIDYDKISLGTNHTCGIKTDGKLYCWGDNAYGQLGDGTTTQRSNPTLIDGTNNYLQVSSGRRHTCALRSDNKLYCWGWNLRGQVGDGSTTQRSSPVPIDSANSYKYVSTSLSNSCAIRLDDKIYCWGFNSSGQVGDGSTTQRNSPVPVSSSLTFKTVVNGDGHVCGLTTSNKIYCWGDNEFGQVGNASYTDRTTPVLIDGTVNYKSVDLGKDHTCGIKYDDELMCWGNNDRGQLNMNFIEYSYIPGWIEDEVYFKNYSLGDGYTCSIDFTNKVYCWGDNTSGQFGDGSTDSSIDKVLIDGSNNYKKIFLGGYHTCGIRFDDKLYCWGDNRAGQLGDGSKTTRLTPRLINFF
ncbi:MAG: InlB B-repeat-containing protein [Candidatus Absconditabacteria bacterium]